MNEYRQNAINHLKTHLGCVGYRDYLVTELEKLEKIDQIIDDCDSGMISCEQLFLNLRTILEKE